MSSNYSPPEIVLSEKLRLHYPDDDWRCEYDVYNDTYECVNITSGICVYFELNLLKIYCISVFNRIDIFEKSIDVLSTISIEYQPNQIVIDGLISITVMHKCVIIKHVYDINEERIIYVPMLILLMQTSDCNNNNESIFVDIILEHSRELIEMYDIHVFK